MNFDLTSDARQIVTLNDTFVQAQFRSGVQDTRIVLFHGANRRNENDARLFQAFLNFCAHQISISDPTIFHDSSLKKSWFFAWIGQALKPLRSGFLEGLGARRGMFFEPDLRNVNLSRVGFVMQHFFSSMLATEFCEATVHDAEDLELICDEERLGPNPIRAEG